MLYKDGSGQLHLFLTAEISKGRLLNGHSFSHLHLQNG